MFFRIKLFVNFCIIGQLEVSISLYEWYELCSVVYDVLDNLDSYEPDEDTLDNPDLAVRLVETKIEVILTWEIY